MNMRLISVWLMAIPLAALSGCGGKHDAASDEDFPKTIQLTSSAFKDGETIPKDFTADGKNVSPALEWTNLPKGTASLALICDDPDAPKGTWVHWVMYDMPADLKGLEENVPAEATLPNGSRQGKNSFDKTGYRGPAPPEGKAHRYYFKLYALDTKPDVPADATKDQLLKAMEKHVLAKGELMGKYQR
jgi:Raf kinase inhibitor-like YbhB/YbcL family protein